MYPKWEIEKTEKQLYLNHRIPRTQELAIPGSIGHGDKTGTQKNGKTPRLPFQLLAPRRLPCITPWRLEVWISGRNKTKNLSSGGSTVTAEGRHTRMTEEISRITHTGCWNPLPSPKASLPTQIPKRKQPRLYQLRKTVKNYFLMNLTSLEKRPKKYW